MNILKKRLVVIVLAAVMMFTMLPMFGCEGSGESVTAVAYSECGDFRLTVNVDSTSMRRRGALTVVATAENLSGRDILVYNHGRGQAYFEYSIFFSMFPVSYDLGGLWVNDIGSPIYVIEKNSIVSQTRELQAMRNENHSLEVNLYFLKVCEESEFEIGEHPTRETESHSLLLSIEPITIYVRRV